MKTPPVDPSILQEHVKKLSVDFSPRSYEEPENLERAAAYIAAEFRRSTDEVTEQVFTASPGRPYKNVIARFGPDTPEVVIVGAHYDAWGGLPGADDNASGVAGLIELAKLLGSHAPKRRVELVAYTLEEPPHFRTGEMGSAQHAAALAKSGKKVRGMISLEMIGAFSDEPRSQRFPVGLLGLVYPDTGNYIVVVGRIGGGGIVRTVKRAMKGASDLPVESINAPRFVPGIDFSDHSNYWDHGFDAVMITDTSFYRNERYHTAQDTWDTLDYARMAKVVQGAFAATHALAQD